MEEKIVIITGANSGIGKEATLKFAQEGYTVIMACRNLEKSKKVQQAITKQVDHAKVELLELDMASFQSIQAFCKLFNENYKKLDVLIHNAAYFSHGEKTYQFSEDQIERSFATNAVGPFLMTQLLIDKLKQSDDSRVLNACTTNIRHFFEPKRTIDFDNLQGEHKSIKPYRGYKMYGDSKMALLLLTFKLAEQLNESRIKVNAIQIPAIKITKDKIKNFKLGWRFAARIQNIFSASQSSMANTYYTICTHKDFANITGKLINDKCEIVKVSHYKNGIRQDIKQFLDKSVYPRYASDTETIDKMWSFAKQVTKQYLK